MMNSENLSQSKFETWPFLADLSILIFFLINFPVQGQLIAERNEPINCYCDSTINNLKLDSDLSPFLPNLQLVDCDPDCRKKYYNADKTETLELYFYPGRIRNHCSYFKVALAKAELSGENEQLPDKHFVSGSGIKLLDSLSKVKSLFNNENITIEQNGDFTILTFEGSKQNEIWCKDYFAIHHLDKSLYRSVFTFKNKILISFEFGYDYM